MELVRIDNPRVSIRGTAELVHITYPLRVEMRDGKPYVDYSGGEDEVFYETAEIQKDENGEDLFLDENGTDVPLSNVGVVTEEDQDGNPITVTPLAGWLSATVSA